MKSKSIPTSKSTCALVLGLAAMMAAPAGAEPTSELSWQKNRLMDLHGFERPMVARTIDSPRGWIFKGGVEWDQRRNSAEAHKTSFIGISPDRSMHFHAFPSYTWASSRYQTPLQFAASRGTATGPVEDSVSIVKNAFLPSQRPGARIVEVKRLPEVSKIATQAIRQFFAGREQSLRLTNAAADVALITIDYSQGERKIRETLFSTVAMFDLGSENSQESQMQRQMGMEPMVSRFSTSDIMAMGTDARNFDQAMPILSRMAQSIKVDIEWQLRIKNYHLTMTAKELAATRKIMEASARAHQTKMQTIGDIMDSNHRAYLDRSAESDRRQRSIIHSIHETVDMKEPHSGTTITLDYDRKFHYSDPFGNTYSSDDPYDDPRTAPATFGRDFREMRRVE